MDAYDWDKTVFAKDTTAEFFLYCCKRYPRVRRFMPVALHIALRHAAGLPPIPAMKQRFYRYFACVPDMETVVRSFWNQHAALIGKPATPCDPRPGDLIISASADFLLREVCEARGLALIATQIDPLTGDQTGSDYFGEEKVRRFRQRFGEEARVDTWYSDSKSDAPMARLADRAFLVKGGKLIPWSE